VGDIAVRPCNNVIGAVIEGVDLANLSDDEFAVVDQALLDHQVVFFHDQPLSDDEHLAFAARFGEPSIFPVSKILGGDTRLQYIEDTEDSPPDADDWHTDVTWIERPPQVAVLSGRVIPEIGGDTMWSSLTAAYDALSPTMQAVCAGLTVRHHRGQDFDDKVGRFLDADQMRLLDEGYPSVEHPLLRTHPRTGETSLFLSGLFMQEIVGMNPDESDALLGFLLRHGQNPNFQVRWRWQADDLAVWDERVTNHRALSDHYPQHRVMRRVTVDGERPVYEGAAH
jgi:taurine dioxygenase